jgi:ankyrin repeat protein
MNRSKLLIRVGLVVFLVLALLGTYFVRKGSLEKQMVAAMTMDDREAVLALLRTFPAPVNAKGERAGQTPLQWAAYRADKDLVELLLAKGADVNVKDDIGQTPLHYAAPSWHLEDSKEVAELLLARGADINAKDENGVTPIHMALYNPFGEGEDFARMLADKGAELDIFAASGLGRVDKLDDLLKKNPALLSAKATWGSTPLHFAVCHGRTEAAALLIAAGADVNVIDGFGLTPLCLAAMRGHLEAARLLIDKGADINARVEGGGSPLKIAILNRHPDIADLLRKHGAKE